MVGGELVPSRCSISILSSSAVSLISARTQAPQAPSLLRTPFPYHNSFGNLLEDLGLCPVKRHLHTGMGNSGVTGSLKPACAWCAS